MDDPSFDAIVLHSGGMDSSICLALAVKEFGNEKVVSFGFSYGQRHSTELDAARKIASYFGVRREEVCLPTLPGWQGSSLVNQNIEISASSQKMPNSFVPGRNGLFTMMAAPFACYVNAKFLYLGVMEIEGVNSGYPDCSRAYVDRVEEVIRLDYPEHRLSIRTPLIRHTKAESLSVAKSLGVLDFLLEATVSCYRGVLHPGCKECPACVLRNQGIEQFLNSDDAQRAR